MNVGSVDSFNISRLQKFDAIPISLAIKNEIPKITATILVRGKLARTSTPKLLFSKVSEVYMQDRYAGDVGDFVKLGLLRAFSPGRQLGVAWYRFPDESHNDDGRHISYLNRQEEYEGLDPELFHHLKDTVSRERSIASLLPVLKDAASADDSLDVTGISAKARRAWRRDWFSNVLDQLSACDLVFADPDNGIIDDQDKRKGAVKFEKQMPLQEVQALASGRCAVIYHHNTRRKGGHDAEVDFWLEEFGLPGFAVRAARYSPRTFFVLNPDEEIRKRAKDFCARWAGMRVWLHE